MAAKEPQYWLKQERVADGHWLIEHCRIKRLRPERWAVTSCPEDGPVRLRSEWRTLGDFRAWLREQMRVPDGERLHGRVSISYPKPVLWVSQRTGYVVTDNGGPCVLVRWQAEDGPRVGRHVVAWRGARHEQWIPRERLKESNR